MTEHILTENELGLFFILWILPSPSKYPLIKCDMKGSLNLGNCIFWVLLLTQPKSNNLLTNKFEYTVTEQNLDLPSTPHFIGFSHSISHALPDGVTAQTPSQTEIILKSSDKQVVGQVAAEIRAYRPPEPYKGKGVRYMDEHVVMKEAKKA